MEKFIPYTCVSQEFSDLQYGFVEVHGTAMAASLTYDVISHRVSKGSTVYTCSLDAEGAFCFRKHLGLFQIYNGGSLNTGNHWQWYSKPTVKIKWNNPFSDTINILKGTR